MSMGLASALSVAIAATVAAAAADAVASVMPKCGIRTNMIWNVCVELTPQMMAIHCTCIDCSMPLSNGLFEWTRELIGGGSIGDGISGCCGADGDSK